MQDPRDGAGVRLLRNASSRRELPAHPPPMIRRGRSPYWRSTLPVITARTAVAAGQSALLYQRAGTVLEGAKRLVAGDHGAKLVVVPFAFRFRRLFDFVDVHVMYHATIFTNAAVFRKEIVDRHLAHFGHQHRVTCISRPTCSPTPEEASPTGGSNHRRAILDCLRIGWAGWRRSADRTRLHANSLLTGNFTGNFSIPGP